MVSKEATPDLQRSKNHCIFNDISFLRFTFLLFRWLYIGRVCVIGENGVIVVIMQNGVFALLVLFFSPFVLVG